MMANAIRFPNKHFESLLMNHWYTSIRVGVLDHNVGDVLIVVNISNDDTLQCRVTKIESITLECATYQHAYMLGFCSVAEFKAKLRNKNPSLKQTDVFTLITTLVTHDG